MSKRKNLSNGSDNDEDSGGRGSRSPLGQSNSNRIIDLDTVPDAGKKGRSEGPLTDDEGDSGRGSGGRTPFKRGTNQRSSILIAETKAMERSRRLMEQQGERRLAAVKARDHSHDEDLQQTPEGELQNSILQHPELDNQRFDGVDPNLNPEPPLNTEARREYDNEKREQDKEKQLRLGNMPQFRSDPRPNGPY